MRIQIEVLKKWIADILTHSGAPEDISLIVADSLLNAEAKGVTTHGIIRLQSYLDSIRTGSLVPGSRPVIVSRRGAITTLSGKAGFGIYATYIASLEAMKMAEQFGIAMAVLKDAHHAGMLEYITDMCATKGFIGVSFSNGHPTVSPPDGGVKVIGTNPLSVSIPSDNGNFNLDFAISKTSFGMIRKSAQNGLKLADNLALDAEGNPTNDPNKAMNGSLLPFGGYKGFGLGLAIDLLSGLLSGSATGTLVETWNEFGRPWNNGYGIIVINPDFFALTSDFKRDVSDYFARFKEISPRSSAPGERRRALYLNSIKFGIEVDDNSLSKLSQLSMNLNLDSGYYKSISRE